MSAARHNLALLRSELEDRLADKAPGALSPRLRRESERLACGVETLDVALGGGVVVGAITELVGAECTGRTTAALVYAAAAIQQEMVGAWIDVDDTLDPESAARSGVDLRRLLWVRCGREQQVVADSTALASVQGVPAAVQPIGLPVVQSGGGSPHPRTEGMGMSRAIQELLLSQPRSAAGPDRRQRRIIGTPGAPNRPLPPRGAEREEQVATDRRPPRRGENLTQLVAAPRYTPPAQSAESRTQMETSSKPRKPKRVWDPLDQALRAADLLLQSGGFRFLVLDLGSTPAEMSWRIPLATWFRYRAACDRTRTSLLLLTRHPCARSSAELVVRMGAGQLETQGSLMTGIVFRAERERQRFEPASNVVPMRKPPQAERPVQRPGTWKGQAAWAI